jgi:hypothetical protein
MSAKQQGILSKNTAGAALSGLALRYHQSLCAEAKHLHRMASIPNDPAAGAFKPKAEQASLLIGAEAPIAFSLEPSNMTVSVTAVMVDSTQGTELPGSEIQIGMVGGLAGDGKPTKPFSSEDLSFAVQQLKEQKQAGLVYGLPNSSGFLQGY